MGPLRDLWLLLLLANQVQATPEGMGVGQNPLSLTVMRGDNATFYCHFKTQSPKYGVRWIKTDPERVIQASSRYIMVEQNQTSYLMITEVALEDSGRYCCEVNVLQREPERGNGSELVVLAPPSPPRIYLRAPPDPQTGQWGLLCLTAGFHPNKLTLTWTHRSEAADVNHLSATNCSLPALAPASERLLDAALLSSEWSANTGPMDQSKCVHVTGNGSSEVFLFSVLFLPPKRSLDAAMTFTCEVRDHPAIGAALTASFTWEAAANELILHLNILKMCLLSAAGAVFALEAVKHFCKLGK